MLPTIMQIPLGRAAKYGQLNVELERLPYQVKDYIFEYGLRQVLNDAMATKTDEDGNVLTAEEIVAKAEKRLANLYDGTLRSRSAGDAEPLDPFEAECYRIAIADLQSIFRAGGKFKGLPKGTKDQLMFVVNAERAKQGLGEIDRPEMVKLFMAKNGKAVEQRAKANLKAREGLDELF